jgi:hypothetical protein
MSSILSELPQQNRKASRLRRLLVRSPSAVLYSFLIIGSVGVWMLTCVALQSYVPFDSKCAPLLVGRLRNQPDSNSKEEGFGYRLKCNIWIRTYARTCDVSAVARRFCTYVGHTLTKWHSSFLPASGIFGLLRKPPPLLSWLLCFCSDILG